jgi:hypothetical protein
MVQRGQHPLGMCPRQIGYPLSFRGQVIGTQSSLPCFPQWSYARGGSLSSGGSRRARFPAFIGTTKPLRHPAPLAPRLMASLRGSVCARLLRVRGCAPDDVRAHRQAGSFVHPVLHRFRAFSKRAKAGPLRFPGDPSRTSALLRDPGRTGQSWPLRLARCCPRAQHGEGFSVFMISRLPQGFSTRCLRFTNAVAVAHARLASGWRAPPLP